ncbi:MAG: GNAT family N-acetyltransferase [Acidobacteria bacterium]|nr:GNAT family N-acetyltransferase [Acidobacteriota bacterium]
MQASDADSVRQLTGFIPAEGYIGKLVGQLVAVVAVTRLDEALRIDNVFVAEDLRRKRIGRFMLDETARQSGLALVVEQPGEASIFLARVGFEEVDGRWIRRVG